MTDYVKLCPSCVTIRGLEEMVCQGERGGRPCHWPLHEVLPIPRNEAERTPPEPPAQPEPQPEPAALPRHCVNGHPLQPGDLLCLQCGGAAAEAAPATPPEQVEARLLAGRWRVARTLHTVPNEAELYLVRGEGSPKEALFKHYLRGVEPEAEIYSTLQALDVDHGPKLLDFGRFDDRAYEVWEHMPLGSLADLPLDQRATPEFVRGTVSEVGKALGALGDVKLIHHNLKPASILVRTLDPLDLVVSDFTTATIADFGLQLGASGPPSKYAAPETIAGAFTLASDWWSLGVIVLELLTRGCCFEGVHDKAFLLHLVTRGIKVPDDLAEEWRELLKGLLTRDPERRWRWGEVSRWLAGERGIPAGYDLDSAEEDGKRLALGGVSHGSPRAYALAAADESRWDEALEALLRGRIATWLEERGEDRKQIAEVRRITGDDSLEPDARLVLALLVLNSAIPLCCRGDVVSPAWMLSHPAVAGAWIGGSLPAHLKRLDREGWIVRLRERADRVNGRIEDQRIPIDCDQLAVAQLATSVQALELRWREKRRHFPEAAHPAVSSLMDRRTPSDEDLILLVSAALEAFRAADEVIEEARLAATEGAVPEFNVEQARTWFSMSRREIFAALHARLRNFSRCGRERADEWADEFRLLRQLPLARVLVLLAIPQEAWKEPPKQQYVNNLLSFFQRKIVARIQRGPLVRLTVGKTTPRLDVLELGTPQRSAESIVDQILQRNGRAVAVDPTAILADPNREQRLRRLVRNAGQFRRDSGVDALYLGFPFLLMGEVVNGKVVAPRVAPVLLWPVTIQEDSAARGTIRIGYDTDREEVRLNPALATMLGAEAAASWANARREILERSHLRHLDVVDVFSTLLTPEGTTLLPVPPVAMRLPAGEKRLRPSAAIFLADFSGLSIAEDLLRLSRMPIDGTALEVAIRAKTMEAAPLPPVGEADRYFTVEADPSQERAVFRARERPGLVVHGPPGTGKSQTIVNIISDCIGRGERVLVVCQKRPALDVVRKRLAAEALERRLFLVEDPAADRRRTLQVLREQLDGLQEGNPLHIAGLRQARNATAQRLEGIAKPLDDALKALEARHEPSGRSYREVIEELIGLEAGSENPVQLTALRSQLGDKTSGAVEELCDRCAPLAPDWLLSGYEGSPLHAVQPFGVDFALCEEMASAFGQFVEGERHRSEINRNNRAFFAFNDTEALRGWMERTESQVLSLPPDTARNVARWFDMLTTAGGGSSACEKFEQVLREVIARLAALKSTDHDEKISPLLPDVPADDLKARLRAAEEYLAPTVSLLKQLNPLRALRIRSLRRLLRRWEVGDDHVAGKRFERAGKLELNLRREREVMDGVRAKLSEPTPASPPVLPDARIAAASLHGALQAAISAASAILSCPISDKAAAVARSGKPDDYKLFVDTCRATVRRADARRSSLELVLRLEGWMAAAWMQEVRAAIAEDRDPLPSVEAIAAALPKLAPFQRFCVRARDLGEAGLAIFALLRTAETKWSALPAERLPTEIRRTIRREARLAWKSAMEHQTPSLLMERAEFDENVRLLGQLDREMHGQNRQLLAECCDLERVARRSQWDEIVMLTGPRARRLREIVDRGDGLGLFSLRPVWLVNPGVASSLFALRPGLFDVVVFDEASQLPVEHALPALFRAKRVVVSGDEKQLPPTSFFASRFESDEDEGAPEDAEREGGEGIDETWQQVREDAVSRKEVKDCEDLLQLAHAAQLPRETLKIHYRSRYRQLIAFSNAAYYRGDLSVPARHPSGEILRVRPIEVVRPEGSLYKDQSNEKEAQKVVDLLRALWVGREPEKRPSIGVVSFNLKQAELIQDVIADRALADRDFRSSLEQERQRIQDGEDMSFFVKNLENVQGDERDMIVFSTTFGRDGAGVFQRKFGVLGQQGGERRLNVAVTRAREKIVIVTSMPVEEISTFVGSRRDPATARDYLQAYLDYAEKVSRGDLESAEMALAAFRRHIPVPPRFGAPFGAAFVDIVKEYLAGQGIPVSRAGETDAFAFDLAVEDPRTGLFGIGIECDPPRHPLLSAARARELWRPKVLSNAVPKVHRVWSRAWYHDPQREQQTLVAAVRGALG